MQKEMIKVVMQSTATSARMIREKTGSSVRRPLGASSVVTSCVRKLILVVGGPAEVGVGQNIWQLLWHIDAQVETFSSDESVETTAPVVICDNTGRVHVASTYTVTCAKSDMLRARDNRPTTNNSAATARPTRYGKGKPAQKLE
eukprot:scpid82398/ scgid25399/ 